MRAVGAEAARGDAQGGACYRIGQPVLILVHAQISRGACHAIAHRAARPAAIPLAVWVRGFIRSLKPAASSIV